MSTEKEVSLTDHQRRLLEHIRACETSGKPITEYCAERGIGVRSMYDARKTMVVKGILPRTRSSRFQRVKVVTPAPSSDWRIQLPNGVSVTFSGGVDGAALGVILKTAVQLG